MVKVVLFTDKYDRFGRDARAWLQQHGIEFTEKDVADDAVWEEMGQLSGQYAIPVIAVDDKVVVGYNERELSALLDGEVKAESEK